ncbi:preprotein translocase subunit YajC [bacterium]|nr:preprotein translocase subunit YajC [bacterium]
MFFLSELGAVLAQASKPGGNFLGSLFPLILIVLVMYLLLIRPQSKRQKQHRQMISELKPGDEVVTSGGVHGSIAGIREKQQTLLVKIADNVKIEVDRASIGRVKTEQEKVGRTSD